MATYISYKGSPDVFEKETGAYVSYDEAVKRGNVFGNIQQLDTLRPGVSQESDFAKVSQTNLPTYAPAPIEPPVIPPKPGIVTTSETPEEKARKSEQDRVRKTILDLNQKILESFNPTPEETQLEQELLSKRQQGRELEESLAQGREDESQKVVPLSVVTGRQASLERQADLKRRAAAITMQPLVDRLETLQKVRGQTAEKAKIAIQLQQATLPEVLKTDINKDTGEIISVERDPLTGAVTSRVVGTVNVEGQPLDFASTSQEVAADGSKIFTGITKDGQVIRQVIAPAGTFSSNSAPASAQEYEYAKSQGYTGSFMDYQKFKATQYGTESPGGSRNYDSRLKEEIGNLYSGRYGTAGAREKVINILRGEFPNANVSSDIYRRIPDGYEKSVKGGALGYEDI